MQEIADTIKSLRDFSEKPADRFELADLIDALPAAVYTTDASGYIQFYNQAAVSLWGQEPNLDDFQWCGSMKLFHPDGRAMAHDECPMAQALKTGKSIDGAEAVAERPDGVRVPFRAYPTPLRNASGKIVGAVNMLVDISHQKRAEEQKELLVRELGHRINNAFAVAQAIYQQGQRHANSVEASSESFIGRLQSLSRCQHLIFEASSDGAELESLARGQIEPLVSNNSDRLNISGPKVRLSSSQATNIGLVLHELGTNAVKYGALSNATGTVEVTWEIRKEKGARIVAMIWKEQGGPEVQEPQQCGFGTQLIENAIPDSKSVFRYEKSGLVCELEFRIS